jgi:bacteriorhodopsin
MVELTAAQYSLVYNSFSFTIAAMGAATILFWLGRSQVEPGYRTALLITGLVTAIATYHYWRIFESWQVAYVIEGGQAIATGAPFNDAYRYVDWLLTVPLLLIELVLVMRLSRAETVSKSWTLGTAAALMIVLGYPGEVAEDNTTRFIFGALSSIPFLYIVYELFRGLGAAIERQPHEVRGLVKAARLVTFASWGFYPLVYMIPYTGISGPTVEVGLQVGYTLADLVAKVGVGCLIFVIALRKSDLERGFGGAAPAPAQ